jgi:4-aminobutyrate aminotransferase-like enzyme/Ser/Thr protein kinase RdoA (MazF antagonist)
MMQADPLTTPPPALSPADAEAVARAAFGLEGVASPLDSERDQNFKITAGESSFLLKVSNRADDLAVLEMQTDAALHIGRCDPALPVMQPLQTTGGAYFAEVEAAGHEHAVRLFTFVQGTMVEANELDYAALHEFGAIVARMGRALRGFFHPAAGYKILWDLKHTPDLRRLLASEPDRERRMLVTAVLDRFNNNVAPAMSGLRAQVIHNDLTLDNVLLDDAHRVSGIVDLGDTTHTALVCDLAIALVSLMWGRPDPLEAAHAVISGYSSVTRLEEPEAAMLSDLVSARLAALVLIASWRVDRYPENADYITGNVDLAWRLLERFENLKWSTVARHMEIACRNPASLQPTTNRPMDHLLERRERVLGPALSPLSYNQPLHLVRAAGVHMFDNEGRAYLDAYNNVPVVGHSHPRVVAAIAEQSAKLNTNTRYLHPAVVELAERLLATMPDGLDTVMFVNSGSEANEIAWRLATAYNGGSGGIVTAHAYHGVTSATAALSPEQWPQADGPPHVATIPAPDDYRGRYRAEEPGWSERYAAEVDNALDDLERQDVRPAALFLDALFTSDGIFAPPPAYLREVVRRVHDAGGLYVADEVQCGHGRSGLHLWGFQSSDVTPDLVTLGKPMGNGHPVAAVITRSEITERFAASSTMFSTFGGNPVACRAALAVLDVIEEDSLMEKARATGARLRASLEALMGAHEAVGDVRGTGLLIGVELVSDKGARDPAPRVAQAVMNEMKERGVLVGLTGPDDNVLKIRPPLVLDDQNSAAITETLDAALTIASP